MTFTPVEQRSLDPYCVRIISNGKPIGSGTIMQLKNGQYFAITAKHVVKDEYDLTIEYYDPISQAFIEQSVSSVYLSEIADIAIMMVNLEKELKEINLIKLLDVNEVAFMGFPNGLDSTELITRYGKYVNDTSLGNIRIQVESPVETNTTSASLNTDNFSGGGVWTRYKGVICFVGIVSTYEESFGTVTCVEISKLEKLLVDNNLSPLVYLDANNIAEESIPVNVVISNIKYSVHEAEELIQTFHPTSATRILTRLQIIVTRADYLPDDIRKQVLAKCSFLLALSISDLGENSNSYILAAHELEPDNILYKERLPLIYLQKGDKLMAIKIANDILSSDPENYRVWGFLDVVDRVIESPKYLRMNVQYKTSVMVALSTMSDDSLMSLSGLDIFFAKDLTEKLEPEDPIKRSEIYFWDFFARYAYQKYLNNDNQVYRALKYKDQYLKNDLLKYCHHLFEKVIKSVEKSELSKKINFIFSKIAFYHSDYLLNDNYISPLKIYDEIIDLGYTEVIERQLPMYIIPLLILKEYDKVQHILDVYSVAPNSDNYFIVAEICASDGNIPNAITNYLKYLAIVEEIDSAEFEKVTAAIEYLTEHVDDIFEIITIIENKNFENTTVKDMALILVYRANLPDSLVSITEIVDRYDCTDIPRHLIKILAIGYASLDKLEIARQILRPLITSEVESFERFYYINLSYRKIVTSDGEGSPEENREIFDLLEHWRTNLSPRAEFLHYEINLYDSIDNYSKLIEVCRVGVGHFPTDPFFVFSWIKANRDSITPVQLELLNIIENDLSRYKFPNVLHFWYIGEYCCQIDRKEIGLHIFSEVLDANMDDYSIRQEYFRVFTRYSLHEIFPDPEIIKAESYIEVRAGNNTYVDNVKKISHLFPNEKLDFICSKKVGDKFFIEKSLTLQTVEYEILGIYSRQNGIFRKISNEIHTEPDLYGKFSVIKFSDNEDPKQFIETLKNTFGLPGTKRKLILENERNKYLRGEIGFTVLSTAYDDPIAVYRFLTQHAQMCFLTVPLFAQGVLQTSQEEYQFVLDFTSLLTLMDVQNNFSDFKILDKDRYVISQSVVDLLSRKIKDLEESSDSPMQVDITVDDVSLHETPTAYHEHLIDSYKKIREWVLMYCTIEHTMDSLGLKVHLVKSWQKEGKEDNKIFLTFVDSQLLTNKSNRILVTEDFDIYRNPLQGVGSLITFEKYFKIFHPEKYLDIVHFLAERQYRGITINEEILWSAYKKDPLLARFDGAFYRLINKNFSSFYNNDQNHFVEALKFIRRIYLEKIDIKFKRHISRTVFGALFKDNYITPETMKLGFEYINKNGEFSSVNMLYIYQDIYEITQKFR